VLTGHYPVDLQRQEKILRRVILKPWQGEKLTGVEAAVFVDATYEGDLAALAEVPFRVGREARAEFKEPHAGKVFTNLEAKPAPSDAVAGRLNIRPYAQRQGSIDPESPFTADRAVQAYNYRFCITNDPKNRRLPGKPANYNREDFLHFDRKFDGRGRSQWQDDIQQPHYDRRESLPIRRAIGRNARKSLNGTSISRWA